MERDLEKFDIPLGSWMELAHKRVEWRRAMVKGKETNIAEWLDQNFLNVRTKKSRAFSLSLTGNTSAFWWIRPPLEKSLCTTHPTPHDF
ncbi:hypothetical protein EON65_22975 [archaeon]|nr:MAG: hypothetical protein EON65_22975 [archaeon]